MSLVKIPPKIKSKPVNGDQVSFTVVDNKTSNKKEHKNQPCFGSYMSSLSNYMFVCRPNSSFDLPDDIYLEWMELCKKNYLAPPSSQFLIEDGRAIARIPGGNESKHRVYSALCCYRFADSLSPLAYEAVILSRERPKLDFFQILHYTMSRYVQHVGHSFCPIVNMKYSLYTRVGASATYPRDDLIYSIGMKWFFKMNKDGSSICGKARNQGTDHAISTYCQNLGVHVKIKKEEEALNPKYTPLYKVKVDDIAKLKSLI